MSSRPDTSAGQGKELGFWMSTALVIGNTIGMGIFLLPASLAPFGFNALIGWGITVAGVIVIARVFARLAQVFPESDGPYAYMRSTLGDWPAFLALWCYWISCWVTNAALAVGVVGYMGSAVPALAGVPPLVLALSLLWIFTGVNLLGTRTGGRMQVLTTVLKLLPMAFIMLLGAWLLFAAPEAYSRNPPPTPLAFDSMLAASTIALYAMLGVESAAVPAGRVRDAARTIPRATMAGTLVTAGVYVVVSAIAIILLPQEELAASTAPFADLLDRFLGTGSGRWLSLFVVVSGLGCLNGWVLLSGELSRTMASHRMLPSWLQASNRHRAPAAGLVATSTLATLMIVMNYSKSLVEGFTFLTLVVTAAALPLYLCCALALVVLWKRGGRPRSAELLALGVLGCAYSVFAFVGMGREPFLWGIALAAAGIPLLFFLRRRTAGTVSDAP